MHITLLEQLAANGLTGSALEEHVIRHNHGGTTVNFEQGFDMLDKVQLLVAGAGPEVVAHDDAGLALLASLFIDKGDATFAPKGWIGQHDIKILAWMTTQAIDHMHWRLALLIAAD